jgi:hypothetical protein
MEASEHDREELRQLLVDFLFSSCQDAPACWYRVNSRENNMLPDGETKALLPSMGNVFQLPGETVNDFLVASGLMKWHGEELTVDVDSWNDLKNERNGDVDIGIDTVSHAQLIGEKVAVIRIGAFKIGENPFNAISLFGEEDRRE